ncbi:MAG: FecR domain-containing protein [Roseivirga sp.]|uniref:FecR family protein n=1 Tax=Roseivirga sp. TaxID=1964215 RepID=UPI001B1D4BDE|nr:FecR domain-containing protein [Roseivirga sp.]MBO6661123.1 FecR domain-containing protein [Roseivirga sp.]MBO6759761.1 FecR domain-containing protein [Roseivirga sp.]MBO6908893.1 FecR domain-containing protein [Roseivirga sp.]
MKNPNDISNELMLKFLSDTATAEEREAMETWMVDSEENAKYIEQLKSLWANAESFSLLDSIDLDQNWQGVQSKVNQQKAGNSKIFWRIAAAVVFIVSASFLAKSLLYSPPEQLSITAQEQSEFTLPDGSVVTLKKGATLKYPEEFEDERRVTFEGEAFFDVVSNPQKPFIINADDTETMVLGTSFNLKTATSHTGFELVLVEGKVSFSTPNEKVVLTPGQRVALGPNGLLEKTENTNRNFQAWQTGTLVFENAKMSDVFQDIGNAYNVRFEMENAAFASCTLTARYDQEDLDSILNTLEILFNTSFNKQQETILVSGGSCN